MRPLLFALTALWATTAHTQTGRLFPTVDAIVTTSQSLYSGSLKDLKLESVEGSPHLHRCHVVFSVDETIKGPEKKELDFAFVSSLPKPFLTEMAVRHEDFLVLSPHEDNFLADDLRIKMGARNTETAMLWFRLYEPKTEHYQDFDHNVFTGDLRVISTFQDLVKEARAMAKRYPTGKHEMVSFTPPNSVSRMCGDPNAYAAVTVPKSPTTEAFARRLLKEPRKVVEDAIRKSRTLYKKPELTHDDLFSMRRAAVQLLAEFPTEPNRALLRPLLQDERLKEVASYALERMGG